MISTKNMFSKFGFYLKQKLILCICTDLQSLLNAEDKKQQLNNTGFVKSARAPIDCVQLQLDDCVQIAYLDPRLLIQSP